MMKEGRLFLYVSPNTIIPLMFLVMVVTTLSIHFSVLTNTTWFGDFFQGAAAVAEVEAAPAAMAPVEVPAPAAAEPVAVEEAAPAAPAAPAE